MTADFGLPFSIFNRYKGGYMKLTNRLKTIAELIEAGVTVGDIGSDHGYLIAELIKNEKITYGIASDINKGPVENCKQTMVAYNIQDKVQVRLGGGFVPYKPGEIHTAVIAGMGGELIRDIFLESPEVVKKTDTFILQAMTGQDVLRRWLLDNQFHFVEEIIAIEQDRYYEIMKIKHGHQEMVLPNHLKHLKIDDPLLMEIGFKMQLTQAYEGFIQKKINKYEVIAKNLRKHAENNPKLAEVNHNLEALKEVLNCIQTQEK